jgi:hypothetical protein
LTDGVDHAVVKGQDKIDPSAAMSHRLEARVTVRL